MAAKSPLKKGEAGAALVAEATHAAAAGGEDGEGRGPPDEVAGAALVVDATCAAAAGGGDDGRTGLGLLPARRSLKTRGALLHQQPPRGVGGTRRRR